MEALAGKEILQPKKTQAGKGEGKARSEIAFASLGRARGSSRVLPRRPVHKIMLRILQTPLSRVEGSPANAYEQALYQDTLSYVYWNSASFVFGGKEQTKQQGQGKKEARKGRPVRPRVVGVAEDLDARDARGDL